MKALKKLLAGILVAVMLLSQSGTAVFAVGGTTPNMVKAILGKYRGSYTATQGATGLSLDIYETDELLSDDAQLQRYADIANSFGYSSSDDDKLTADEVKSIVEKHTDDYIAIVHFYPTDSNSSVENGLYTSDVNCGLLTKDYDFTADEWIQHKSYSMVDFKDVTLSGTTLEGDVYGNLGGKYDDYGDMSVTKGTSQPEETKSEDTKPEDTKPEDTKPEDTKPEESNTPTEKEAGFTLSTTYEADSISLSGGGSLSPKYKISAKVENPTNTAINNVKLTLELPEGARVSDGTTEKTISTVGHLNDETVTWTVTLTGSADAQYKVTAEADGAKVTKHKTIFMSSKGKKDNTISYSSDVWDYDNSDPYFGKGYYINDQYYKQLSDAVTNTEMERIDYLLDMSWGGSCYGMVTIAALNKLGHLKAGDYHSSASELKDLPDPKDSDEVYSLTTYYHVTQKLDSFYTAEETCLSMDEKARTKALVEAVENIGKGGSPVILCIWYHDPIPSIYDLFATQFYGHAILAYDIEYGNYNVKGIADGIETKYDKRILIYDPNDHTKPIYMYINSDCSAWMIDGYCQISKTEEYENNGEGYFFFIDDPTIIDPINVNDTKADQRIRLTSDTDEKLKIKTEDEDGEEEDIYIEGLEILDLIDTGIVSFIDGILGDGNNAGNRYGYSLPTDTKDVTITPDDGSVDLNMSCEYDGVSYSAKVTEGRSIAFSGNDTVTLDCNGAYTLNAVYNEPADNSPWYNYTLEGNTSGKVNLTRDKDGNTIISGNDLDKAVLKMKNGENELSRRITTDADSVLVKAVNGAPALYIDTDGDGSYETLLADNGGTENNAKSSLAKDNLPIIAIVVIAAAGVVTGVVIYRKKNRH